MSSVTGAQAKPSWERRLLGDVARVVGGGTPTTSKKEYFQGDIPWITPSDLTGYNDMYIARGARSITKAALDSCGATMVPAGTVLFSSRAPIGYVAIAANPLCTNQGFRSFVLDESLDPEYVYYYLKFAKPLAVSMASGTTFKELSGKAAGQLPIPVPDLETQREIVARLDEQFSRLDAGVAALRRAQANLKRYRASVLKAACEGRLVPTEAELARQEGRTYETGEQLLTRILEERRASWSGKGKYKDPTPPDTTNLPDLPEGWVWASMDQLAQVGTGATPKRGTSAYYDNATIPWITSGALNSVTVNLAKEFVTETALRKTNLTLYDPGTLLVAMYGEGKTRGKCAELMITATTNQAIAALIVPAIVRPFVKLCLHNQYETMRRVASGGVQPNLNLSLIREIAIPLPPLPEQQRIVDEGERRTSVAEALATTLIVNLARTKSVRSSLLKSVFSYRDDHDE